jgi:hypothetical protein
MVTVLRSTQMKHVSASTVPSFIYKQKKVTSTDAPNFFETLNIQLEHYILALSICTFLFIVSVTIYLLKQRKTSNSLVVELTNGKDCVQIPLIHLSLCPNYWRAYVPQTLDCISIRGFWYPILSFDWDCCHLTNKLSGKLVSVQKQHHVSPLTSRKIRKILSSTYCVYFYFQHGQLLIPLSNHLPDMN